MKYTLTDPKPFQHQLDGVRRIVESGGKMALLCDPGTGKSRMVIDYLGLLAVNFDRPVRVLIASPKSVQDSWLTEFDKWLGPDVGFYAEVLLGTIGDKCRVLGDGIVPTDAPSATARYRKGHSGTIEVAILNYEVLSSRRSKTGPRGGNTTDATLVMRAVEKWKPDVLVCDESHRLKSNSSNAGRMAARIAQVVPRRLLLTGTPMPHSPLDVYSQWKILNPLAFATGTDSWNFSTFRSQYAQMGGFAGSQVIGFQRLDDMQQRMEQNSYVVHKQDCLDLPPVTMIDVDFPLNPTEKAAYRAMKRDMRVLLSDNTEMNAANMLTKMLRLRQISCGFMTDDDGVKTQLGTSRLDRCVELLEDIMAGESRCVIFAWSRWECEKLYALLQKNPIHDAVPMLITGDTSDVARQTYRAAFGSQKKQKMILIAQSRTISLGVNELVTSAYGIFLSLSQQRDDLVQAMARLDRQGQTRPVSLYFLVARGTIDQVVLQSHRDRTDLEAAVLAHLKEA